MYRQDALLPCPSCGEPLRELDHKLCCDACTGIMLSVADLTAALQEHVGAVPMTIQLVESKSSNRSCPRCRAPMTICHLDASFAQEIGTKQRVTHTKPELDRCIEHGVWFDADELATVLEALRHASELPDRASVKEIAIFMIKNWGRGIRGDVPSRDIKLPR